MDDQVAVRIGHRFADVAEQPQSRRQIGVVGPAPRASSGSPVTYSIAI